MDIRFSTDMQSNKDTKYIFSKSDKLPYRLCSKFTICLFALFVWNYHSVKKKQQTISYSKKQKVNFFELTS